MSSKTLVGMYFLFDSTGDSYRTGEVLEIISDGHIPYYLLKFDPFNGVPLPFEVVSIDDFTFENECTCLRQFNFFHSREELNAWIKYIDSPPDGEKGEKVVSLVKTGKGNLKKKVADEEEDD